MTITVRDCGTARTAAVIARLGLVAALFPLAGCFATKADVEVMGSSVRRDVAALQEGQRAIMSGLLGGLDSLEAADSRLQTTMLGELERRIRSLERLFNELLEVSNQNNLLLQQILDEMADLAAQAPPMGVQPGIPNVSGADPAGPGGGPASAAGRGSSAMSEAVATQLYGMALDQFNRGNVQAARESFRNFLAEDPDHPLAPDAQFFLGRVYEDLDDIGNALASYQRVAELYPESGRAPSALFRRARLAAERGNTAIARRLLEQVETKYPDSVEAPLAREERARLGG